MRFGKPLAIPDLVEDRLCGIGAVALAASRQPHYTSPPNTFVRCRGGLPLPLSLAARAAPFV